VVLFPIGSAQKIVQRFDVRNVVVFGGSAGGIQALLSILKELPSNLEAGALAVIHTSEQSTHLPQVLARCSTLEVVAPAAAEPIVSGRVYVAAPNRHLIVRSHCAVSWMGPRENRHRPAVDALFRSAARAYRSRVIAVVLSGALDDGSAGALAVKSRGGTVIVQDPKEALMDEMPANVLRQVEIDHCAPLTEIPELLVRLISKNRPMKIRKASRKQCQMLSESRIGEVEPQAFTCPECDGALTEIVAGKSVQFRCHVGHAYSLASFSEAHADALERALWVALRRLNEQRSIHETLAKSSAGRDVPLKKRYQENIVAADRDIHLLHEILARL
jgi:two-component system chemotaxis response regulator CheB